MKLVMILCSEVIATDVTKMLAELRPSCYVEIPRALGASGEVRRLDTPAFPGTASVFFVGLQDDQAEQLLDRLRQYSEECPHQHCMEAMVLQPVQVLPCVRKQPGTGEPQDTSFSEEK